MSRFTEILVGTDTRGKVLRGGTIVGLVAGGAIGYEIRAHQDPKPTPIIRTADGLVPASTEGTVIPITTATVIAASKAEATNAPEIVTSTMELPKPAAWDHAPVVSLIKAVNVPSFPKTAAEAAATFGVDGSTRNPSRWEKTPEGDGWHLSEAQIGDDTKDALNVNPKGYLVEFYYDTKPGRNSFAGVAVGIDSKIPVQGGTFWNVQQKDQAAKLQREMAIPMWKDDNGNVTAHPATIIVPNQEQKAKAESATLAPAVFEYPQTADKAAMLFGGKAEQWKLNPSGDWNFNSTDGEVTITLDGETADGYNGKGPVVVTGLYGKVEEPLLGATIYNVNSDGAKELVVKVQAKNPDKEVQVVGFK